MDIEINNIMYTPISEINDTNNSTMQQYHMFLKCLAAKMYVESESHA